MSWLKRKVIKWVREDWENKHAKKEDIGIVLEQNYCNSPNKDPVLVFKVYGAENGKIIEFSKYDNIKGTHNNVLYIIHKEEDISEKISKYMNLELLR